ncbi:MAG: hypothetical protein ABSA75_14165 [Candidatus Bathyarchaeia archaeon]|jgi:hypothetical protein
MQEQAPQIKVQRTLSIEHQKNLRKKAHDAEEKFKRDSAAYLQRLISEREKTKPTSTNP